MFRYSEPWVNFTPREVKTIPKQTITGLLFIIFSINMTLSLTYEKKTKIKKLSKDILH